MTESVLLFINSSILLAFLKISFKMFESNLLYYKNTPCVKISFDLFLLYLYNRFCLFGISSTKGAALRNFENLELNWLLSKFIFTAPL